MPRTPNEITAEIHALKAVRPNFPASSEQYGTISAQIIALQTYMTHALAHDAYPPQDHLERLTEVLDAIDWRDGQRDEPPSQGWQEMLE